MSIINEYPMSLSWVDLDGPDGPSRGQIVDYAAEAHKVFTARVRAVTTLVEENPTEMTDAISKHVLEDWQELGWAAIDYLTATSMTSSDWEAQVDRYHWLHNHCDTVDCALEVYSRARRMLEGAKEVARLTAQWKRSRGS